VNGLIVVVLDGLTLAILNWVIEKRARD